MLGSLFWFVERKVRQKRGNLNNRTFRGGVYPRTTRERPAKNIREGVGGEILIFVLFWEDVKGRERSQSAAANFTMKEKRLSNASG